LTTVPHTSRAAAVIGAPWLTKVPHTSMLPDAVRDDPTDVPATEFAPGSSSTRASAAMVRFPLAIHVERVRTTVPPFTSVPPVVRDDSFTVAPSAMVVYLVAVRWLRPSSRCPTLNSARLIVASVACKPTKNQLS